MLLKLLVEILALVGASAGKITDVLTEVHSSDPTGTKVANAATAAASIVAAASAVIEAAKTPENGSLKQ